jgi:hypothetical protein
MQQLAPLLTGFDGIVKQSGWQHAVLPFAVFVHNLTLFSSWLLE